MTKLRETGNILIWRGLVTTMYNPVRIFIVKQTVCPRSLVVRRFSQWRGDIFSSGCLLWSIILVSDWCLPTCPRRVIIKDYITATYWVWDGWPTTYHLPLYLTGTSRHGTEREREIWIWDSFLFWLPWSLVGICHCGAVWEHLPGHLSQCWWCSLLGRQVNSFG